MSILEELALANPGALLADGLEAALIGYTINSYTPHVAVYDAQKCVKILMDRDGMTHEDAEDAEEFLEHNTFCSYVGPNGPLYVRTIMEPTNAAEEGLLSQDCQQKHQV